MMTRAILFLLAMMTGLSAAQAADRSRAQPSEISSTLVQALSAQAGAAVSIAVRHHAPLIEAANKADFAEVSAKPFAPVLITRLASEQRLRPDVALE